MDATSVPPATEDLLGADRLPRGCMSDDDLLALQHNGFVKTSRFLSNILTTVVDFLSGEWLISIFGRANGGGIIVVRATFIASILFFVVLPMLVGLWDVLTGTPLFSPVDVVRLTHFWHRHATWLAILFGSSYTALYARFAAQWRYLADVYNKIKEAEVKYGESGADKIAEWKAGFVEDAIVLHLSTKPVFAQVIKVWLENTKVRDSFLTYSGDADQYNKIRLQVLRALARRA